jgi:hypothetical protein
MQFRLSFNCLLIFLGREKFFFDFMPLSFSLLSYESTLLLLLFGALGALTKDIVLDNTLVLPKICNGGLSLGFIGGVLSGAIVGYLVDNNVTTAFLAGYAGTSILDHLALSKLRSRNPDLVSPTT